MSWHDDLTSDEKDMQSQPLIQGIRRLYPPDAEDARSLERIRARLLQQSTEHEELYTTQSTPPVSLDSYRGRSRHMQIESTEAAPIKKKMWTRSINTLVAVVIAAILIGSIVAIASVGRQSQPGSGGKGPNSSIPGHVPPTPTAVTPMPTFTTPGPDWKVLGHYNGVGSMTKQGMHFVLPKVWGMIFGCAGSGKYSFHLNNGSWVAGPYCTNLNKTYIHNDPAAPITQFQVQVDQKTAWQLLIMACTDTSHNCGTPFPTPTPAPGNPTPIPTPTPGIPPTPTPGNVPTPTPVPPHGTPTPMPTPTLAPVPTPTPVPHR